MDKEGTLFDDMYWARIGFSAEVNTPPKLMGDFECPQAGMACLVSDLWDPV